MNLLQVIPHYIPAYRFGGPQRVAHPLAKALIRAGHHVVVCTTNLADSARNLDVVCDAPVIVDGVTVYYEPTIISRYWGFSPRLWRRITHELPEADAILVHAHFQFANWAGAWLARHAQKPYVIFAHGSLHQAGIASSRRWVKRIYLKLLEERNFRQASFLVFNAPEEKRLSLYGELGRVIPSGIDVTDFEPWPIAGSFRQQYTVLQDKIVFLFLGRLDVTQKGLDLLIPAFARLVHTFPRAHLVLAGPDEGLDGRKIKALIDEYRLSQAITLTGMITGCEKLAALQDADVFVLPSRYEGLSIALLEALYAGLPTLVTDQAGLAGEVRNTGAGMVVAAQVDAIYDGLVTLMSDPLRQAMRGRAKDLIVRKYTWDSIAASLVDQIQSGSQHV